MTDINLLPEDFKSKHNFKKAKQAAQKEVEFKYPETSEKVKVRAMSEDILKKKEKKIKDKELPKKFNKLIPVRKNNLSQFFKKITQQFAESFKRQPRKEPLKTVEPSQPTQSLPPPPPSSPPPPPPSSPPPPPKPQTASTLVEPVKDAKPSEKYRRSVFKVVAEKLHGLAASLKKKKNQPTKSAGGKVLKEEEVSGVELLREDITGGRSAKPEVVKLLVLSGVIFLINVIIFGFYQYKYDEAKDKTDRFKQEIEIFDKELAGLQARQDKIKDSLKMVNAVNVLFETRIDWLSFLKEIEKRTLKSVYYTELKAQGIDNVFLRGRAKTTEDGLVQMKVFRTASEFMQDVAVKNFAVREEEVTVQKTGEGTEGEKTEEIQKKSFVEFEVEFKVNPEWLKLRN